MRAAVKASPERGGPHGESDSLHEPESALDHGGPLRQRLQRMPAVCRARGRRAPPAVAATNSGPSNCSGTPSANDRSRPTNKTSAPSGRRLVDDRQRGERLDLDHAERVLGAISQRQPVQSPSAGPVVGGRSPITVRRVASGSGPPPRRAPAAAPHPGAPWSSTRPSDPLTGHPDDRRHPVTRGGEARYRRYALRSGTVFEVDEHPVGTGWRGASVAVDAPCPRGADRGLAVGQPAPQRTHRQGVAVIEPPLRAARPHVTGVRRPPIPARTPPRGRRPADIPPGRSACGTVGTTRTTGPRVSQCRPTHRAPRPRWWHGSRSRRGLLRSCAGPRQVSPSRRGALCAAVPSMMSPSR